MSIFASESQSDPIALPHAPEISVVVRKLTGLEVELAQGAHLKALVNGHSPRSWSTQFHRLLTKGLATEKDVLKVLADPLSGFDRITVVKAGLVSWTAPASKCVKDTAGTPSPAALDDLDDPTLEFIATEVMRLTKPERFQTTAEEREAAKKKD